MLEDEVDGTIKCFLLEDLGICKYDFEPITFNPKAQVCVCVCKWKGGLQCNY